MTGKPAPMADDVLELAKRCAEAIGISTYWNNTVEMWWCKDKNFPVDGKPYDPASDPIQAFELLCWLAERGTVAVRFSGHGFSFIPFKAAPGSYIACATPAELRLAIMRAVAAVKDSQDGR